jgi:hypothetical protein
MLQLVEVRSPAKLSTRLGSTIRVSELYDFAETMKLAIW